MFVEKALTQPKARKEPWFGPVGFEKWLSVQHD